MKPPNCLALLLVAMFASATASAQWNEKVLYSFQGRTDGSTPAGGVVFDSAGNLYGATTDGGSSNCLGPFQCGTVYQLRPPAQQGDPWTETVLHVFQGTAGNDGASPFGGLVRDQAGNLYGTTGYDGSGNCTLLGSRVGCGTVYQLRPPAMPGGVWTESVIYNFQGGTDGQLPVGELVFDQQGNLYGATQYGGGYGSCNPSFYRHCGTIFKLSPPKVKGGAWTERVLHGFKGGADGATPNGGLLLDSTGAVYGTTQYGGGSSNCTSSYSPGCGTAFKLNPPTTKGGAWTETILHRFKDGADGSGPNGGLIFDAAGALYGTGGGGGAGTVGVVFRLAAATGGEWVETVLHNFTVDKGGRNPWGPVTFDSSGNLYGTAHAAASDKFGGVVFAMRPTTDGLWSFAVLYNFAGAPDAAYPVSKLIFGRSKTLYSTTQAGGSGQGCQGGCGTVFLVSPR